MQNTERNTPREYCSESNPDESLWGTADTVDVWLCLEYRPVWKGRALADNALSAPVRNWLTTAVDTAAGNGIKVRPQFIRQPEIDRDDVHLLLATNGCCVEFSGRGYDFLLDLDLDAVVAEPRHHPGATVLDAPRYLVCTNGQRDLCCARFGLPTYAALKERVGDRAWQVTHLGGHRFAPNVLVLPDACLYGRVDADTADDFLEVTEQGRVDFARLRGRTCYPPVVQAAEAALGRQGMRLLHVDGDASAATVTFAPVNGSAAVEEEGRLSVAVARADQPVLVTKSCGDESPAEIFSYVAG